MNDDHHFSSGPFGGAGMPPAPTPEQLSNQVGLGLSSISWNKPTFQNAYFRNQDVRLDGTKFIRCRFDNCTFHASTPDIEIYESILSDCKVAYGDPASRLIALFLHGFNDLPAEWDTLVPVRHVDGTMTIAPR